MAVRLCGYGCKHASTRRYAHYVKLNLDKDPFYEPGCSAFGGNCGTVSDPRVPLAACPLPLTATRLGVHAQVFTRLHLAGLQE